MAAEYALTAVALLNFGRNPPLGERAFVRWALFADWAFRAYCEKEKKAK